MGGLKCHRNAAISEIIMSNPTERDAREGPLKLQRTFRVTADNTRRPRLHTDTVLGLVGLLDTHTHTHERSEHPVGLTTRANM